MSTRASSAKRKAASHQVAGLSSTEDANVEGMGAASRPKKIRKAQAPSGNILTPEIHANATGNTAAVVVAAAVPTPLRRPKGQRSAKLVATTHKSTEGLPLPEVPPSESRKRPSSAAAPSQVMQDSAVPPPSKRPRRAPNVDVSAGKSFPVEKANAVKAPHMLAPTAVQSEPARTRRKARVPLIDFEEVLATPASVPEPRTEQPHQSTTGSGNTQPILKSAVGTRTLASKGSLAEPAADEGADSDGEDEVSEENSQSDEDNAELSESEDGLEGRAPAALGASLAAERAVWSGRSMATGKGKARAVDAEEFVVDESSNESQRGSDEDEYDDEDMYAVEDEHEMMETSDVGFAGPSSTKAAPTASKNKAPTKRDLKSALEQPAWKPVQSATSTSAPCALQIWTPVSSSSTPSTAATPAVPGTIPVTLPIAPTTLPIASTTAAAQQAVTVVAGPPAALAAEHAIAPPAAVAPVAIAAPTFLAPHQAQAPPPQPWPLVMPALLPPAGHDYEYESDDEGLDNDQPGDYLLVPPATAGGVLTLTVQHSRIKAMMKNAFPRIDADLAFHQAFPDSLGRSQSVVKAMVNASTELGFRGLAARIRMDNTFTRILTSIPNQRVSTFRSAIKKSTDAHVTAFYQVVPNACAEKITWLFEHLTYIYPYDYERRTIPWNKPYQNPAVGALLRTNFFGGGGSFAHKHAGRFSSSLVSRPNEIEIPPAMLALVATALHASLMEWKSGVHRPFPFSAEAYVDVYNEHYMLIMGIRKQNARAYHTMMHRLFNVASGELPAAGPAPGANAFAQVDVDAMDVD